MRRGRRRVRRVLKIRHFSILRHRVPAVGESSEALAQENGHARRVRATKERILAAALDAFAREGYGAATVEAIATAAGTAPASVYNHFESKAGVAQALAEDALAAHDRYVAATWALEAVAAGTADRGGGRDARVRSEQPTLFQAMSLSYLRPLGLFPADTAPGAAISARREQQLQRVADQPRSRPSTPASSPDGRPRDLALHHRGMGGGADDGSPSRRRRGPGRHRQRGDPRDLKGARATARARPACRRRPSRPARLAPATSRAPGAPRARAAGSGSR